MLNKVQESFISVNQLNSKKLKSRKKRHITTKSLNLEDQLHKLVIPVTVE